MCQANRLFVSTKKNLTKIDLMTIEVEEIYASSVFRDGQIWTEMS